MSVVFSNCGYSPLIWRFSANSNSSTYWETPCRSRIFDIVAHTVAVMNHREQRNTLCMTHKDMEQLQEIYQMSTPYETVHEVTR